MIFHHDARNLWLNTNAIRQTITDPNELTRMDEWLSRSDRDPIPRFEREGWVLLVESEPQYRGEPLTGERSKAIDAGGDTFSWMVGADRWDDAIDTAEQQRRADAAEAEEAAQAIAEAEAAEMARLAAIEKLRAAMVQTLTEWWDTHPGVTIAEGITLPIQEIGRNTNTSAFSLVMLVNAQLGKLLRPLRPVKLVDVNDYTVEVSAADAMGALSVFESAYYSISQHWDTTHRAIIAATTLEELQAIDVVPG